MGVFRGCNRFFFLRISAILRDKLTIEANLKLVPWGGVAAPLTEPLLDTARAYCFLPLPVKTGLPVHVNGYFELSSNRRDIWYGSDMTGVGTYPPRYQLIVTMK